MSNIFDTDPPAEFISNFAGEPPATDEQQAIMDTIADPDGPNVCVQAGAGTGKTNTFKRSSKGVSPYLTCAAMSFNTRTTKDLLEALPPQFVVKSINGFGHGAFLKSRHLKFAKPDEKKGGKIITEMAKKRKTYLTKEQWEYARTLFREAQIKGLVPEPFGHQYRTLVEDTKEGWQSLADNMAMPEDDFNMVVDIARDALLENIRLALQGIISFDDQVYCSVLLGGIFNQYDWVWADEFQDFNPLQIEMLKLMTKPSGRIAVVGDRYQSIYAFRGAVGNAFQEIRPLKQRWVDLPLMTSFRCPKLVAARQTGHVPGYRAYHANKDGQLLYLNEADGWYWSQALAKFPVQDNIAVLCRNNAPLISMAFRMIRQGIGCYVLGRDIGKGLKALSLKIAKNDDMKADVFVGHVNDWLHDELAKARIAENEDVVDKFTDKAQSLIAITQSAECQDAGQVRTQIDKLFSRDSGAVTLSTIHKAKGLEWPAVVHLDYQKVPSIYAQKKGGEALQQELNLKYVAETRTKDTLAFATLESFQ